MLSFFDEKGKAGEIKVRSLVNLIKKARPARSKKLTMGELTIDRAFQLTSLVRCLGNCAMTSRFSIVTPERREKDFFFVFFFFLSLYLPLGENDRRLYSLFFGLSIALNF